jgi:hypothetical protein
VFPAGERKSYSISCIGYKQVPLTARLDQGKRLEKIELIDTLLEYAADIVTDMKGAKGRPDDAREKELQSLLFQILSLLFAIRSGNDSMVSASPNPDSLLRKLFNDVQADIIELDRRKPDGDRRRQNTIVADDRRLSFSDRRRSGRG